MPNYPPDLNSLPDIPKDTYCIKQVLRWLVDRTNALELQIPRAVASESDLISQANLLDRIVKRVGTLERVDAATVKTYYARVYSAVNIATADGVPLTLTFDTVRKDTGRFYVVATPTYLTFHTAGFYLVGATVRFASSAVGQRALAIRLNGANSIAVQYWDANAALPHDVSVSTGWYFNVEDHVEMLVVQSSGGALNVLTTASFSPEMWCVGPIGG